MGILITDQLTQLSTESEVLNEVAKNPGIIWKYLQDLTTISAGVSRSADDCSDYSSGRQPDDQNAGENGAPFLRARKSRSRCGFLSEFFCEICALFCAGNDYSGAVWRDDKLCDCRAGVL